jgi:hypothetical protein
MPISTVSPAFLAFFHSIFIFLCPSSSTTAAVDSMSRDEIAWCSVSPVTKMDGTHKLTTLCAFLLVTWVVVIGD